MLELPKLTSSRSKSIVNSQYNNSFVSDISTELQKDFSIPIVTAGPRVPSMRRKISVNVSGVANSIEKRRSENEIRKEMDR